MRKEIVIGREGDQLFKIEAVGVSRRHARIIIEDDVWMLEDLNSANGTFVQMDNGQYERIGNRRISPISRIRLGDETVNGGVSFIARKAVPGMEGNDYRLEFNEIEKIFDKIQEERREIRAKNKQKQLLITLLPLVLMLVSIPMKGMAGVWFMRGSLAFTSVLGLFLINKNREVELIEQGENLLVCPQCGRPLSKYDIKSHSHLCGAKG
ncbi:MAG: FHA domain-containing protein [Bacteroidales bacterium]|nr:FHA domain-containing protein [Bacteroidales bacterium]